MKIRKKIANQLDIPESAVITGTEIHINEKGETVIDGKCSVISYENNEIVLSLHSKKVTFTGENLIICGLTPISLELRGKISQIIFTN